MVPVWGKSGTEVFSSIGSSSQLDRLLSTCSEELSIIAGACLDLVQKSVKADINVETSNSTVKKSKEKSMSMSHVQEMNPISTSARGEVEVEVDLIMASTCVRWLVTAFPSPLLESVCTTSDDAPAKNQSTPKRKSKAVTVTEKFSDKTDSNKDKLTALLLDLSRTISKSRTIGNSTSSHSLAHYTQLVISILNQTTFRKDEDSGTGTGTDNLINAMSVCQKELLGLVRRYSALITKNPYSVVSVWALLRLLSHLKSEKENEKLKANKNMSRYDEEQVSVLTSLLSVAEISDLLNSIGSGLQTPSYWLRVCLLKLLSYLPHPKLSMLQVRQQEGESAEKKDGEKGDEEGGGGWSVREKQEEERSVDIALLCLETACTPAELRAEREFARRAGKLEVHVRSGRLPAPYVRLICSMCLGLLNVKFKPFWEPSIMLLIAAAGNKAGESVLWPLLLDFIQKASKKTETAPRIMNKEKKGKVQPEEVDYYYDFVNFAYSIEAWGRSIISQYEDYCNNCYLYLCLVLTCLST